MKEKKNSKHFLSLEKRHYKNGVISQLRLGDNDFACSDREMLSECETFYRDIYSSKLKQTVIIQELTNYFLETLLQNL